MGVSRVEQLWECELRERLKENADMALYFKNGCEVQRERLTPRMAIFGGRCQLSRLYCRAGEGEEIFYIDICSL